MSYSFGVDSGRSRSLIKAACLLLPLVAAFFFPSINEAVFFFVNGPGRQSLNDPIWAILTNLGDGFFLFPLAMLLFIRRPEKQLSLILTCLIGTLLLRTGKAMIPTLRPVGELGLDMVNVLGPVLKKGAVPSGHAGTVFLLAGLSFLYTESRTRWLVLLLATLSAISRVAVGAHWPLDILLGAELGLVAAICGDYLASNMGKTGPGGSSKKSAIFFILLGLLCAGVLPFYDNGFRSVWPVVYVQYLFALLALFLSVNCILSIFHDEVEAYLSKSGTRRNRLWQKYRKSSFVAGQRHN